MAYRLYMDGILFPVTPSKITMKINGKNETVTLINEGEANILKSTRLRYTRADSVRQNTIWTSWKR